MPLCMFKSMFIIEISNILFYKGKKNRIHSITTFKKIQ